MRITPPENGNSLGTALMIFLAWKNMSQLQVSVKAEMYPAALTLIKNGDRSPKLTDLHRIAQALGVSTDDIMRVSSELSKGTWRP